MQNRGKTLTAGYAGKRLIDTSQEKFQETAGLKRWAEIIKYAQQYEKNRPYQIRYRKAKNPDDYFRKYETELVLYDGAKEMLRQAYQTAEKEGRQLERELDKLEQYLSAEPNTVSMQKHSQEPTR